MYVFFSLWKIIEDLCVHILKHLYIVMCHWHWSTAYIWTWTSRNIKKICYKPNSFFFETSEIIVTLILLFTMVTSGGQSSVVVKNMVLFLSSQIFLIYWIMCTTRDILLVYYTNVYKLKYCPKVVSGVRQTVHVVSCY